MSPRQLDKLLEARSGTAFFPAKSSNPAGGDVAEAMQNFVNAKSSVEGVEAVVDKRPKGVRPRSASARRSEMSTEDETEEEVKMDVGGILQSMHELLSK